MYEDSDSHTAPPALLCSRAQVGASQALYLTLQTLLSPGDEVVILEPFFDLYLGQIRLAGGEPRFARTPQVVELSGR